MKRNINVISLLRSHNISGNDMLISELTADSEKGYIYIKLVNGQIIPIRCHLATLINEDAVLASNGVVIDHKIFKDILTNFVIVEDDGKYKLGTDSIPSDLMIDMNGEQILDIGKCFIYMIAASRAMHDTYTEGVLHLETVFKDIETKLDEKIQEAEAIVDSIRNQLDLISRNTTELTTLRQGRTTVLRDELGIPSMMVKIPMFLLSDVYDNITPGSVEDVPHPAFVVNGKTVSCIYVSKYLNTVINGRAYSHKDADPSFNGTFEDAIQNCENKGNGWHLMTNAEWGAIMGLTMKHSTNPMGNTYYGVDYAEPSKGGIASTYISTTEKFRGYDFDGTHYKNIATTLTGSGPVEFSHDLTSDGIYGLSGDVEEFIGGIRLFRGEIQVIQYNDGAQTGIDQSFLSTEWSSIDMATGDYVGSTPIGNVYYDLDSSRSQVVFNTSRSNISPGGSDTDTSVGTVVTSTFDSMPPTTLPNRVEWLGLNPVNLIDQEISLLNTGERIVLRGGNYTSGATGFGTMNITKTRTDVSQNLYGFRSVYIDPNEYQ